MHLASRSPPHLVSHSAPQFLSQLLSNAGGRTDRRNTPWLRHTHTAPPLREARAAITSLQQELRHLGGWGEEQVSEPTAGTEAPGGAGGGTGFGAVAVSCPQHFPARGSRPLEEICNN